MISQKKKKEEVVVKFNNLIKKDSAMSYKENDQSKAVCSHCERLVTTTFQYRNVPFSDTKEVANNILAAVCNECDSVVAIPAQSTNEIKKQRELLNKF